MAEKSAERGRTMTETRLSARRQITAARQEARGNGTAAQLNGPDPRKKELSKLQKLAAKKYAEGMGRATIAKDLVQYLSPKRRDLKMARTRLAQWEKSQEFRDEIWAATIRWLDLQAPTVVKAMVQKAKTGRVNEAKFVLELSGRYQPHGDQAPTAVNVVISGIPRPEAETIEGEAVEAEYEVLDSPLPRPRSGS